MIEAFWYRALSSLSLTETSHFRAEFEFIVFLVHVFVGLVDVPAGVP